VSPFSWFDKSTNAQLHYCHFGGHLLLPMVPSSLLLHSRPDDIAATLLLSFMWEVLWSRSFRFEISHLSWGRTGCSMWGALIEGFYEGKGALVAEERPVFLSHGMHRTTHFTCGPPPSREPHMLHEWRLISDCHSLLSNVGTAFHW
jgi:hypothetical protein